SSDLPGINFISAWIFIPNSEPIRDHNFLAHILVYKYDKNRNPIGFTSRDTKVEPGKWTHLVIGTFQNTSSIPDFIWNGDINELYVSIWSDKDYNGSIYIDDIELYR
ncbi:MAG: hypothetical protein NTW32_20650, partial [Chloroflexi bacterium]|nr:hypothetical protein [Chloroflexota bacterium]